MGEPSVEFERLVRRDSEQVPSGASTAQVDHQPHGLDRSGRLDDEIRSAGNNVVDAVLHSAFSRVDGVGGAERERVFTGPWAWIDGDQPTGASSVGNHQAQQADAADANDHHVVAQLHLAVLDHTFPGTGEGFGQGCCVERDVGRLVKQAVLVGQHVLGERSRPDVLWSVATRRECMLAVVGVAGPAVRAEAAEPRGLADHLIAGFEMPHAGTDFRNDSRGLVAWDHRKSHIAAHAFDRLVVRLAKPARLDLHQHRARGTRNGTIHVLKFQNVEVVEHRRQHLAHGRTRNWNKERGKITAVRRLGRHPAKLPRFAFSAAVCN